MKQLQNKVVVLTGAGSGIGRALAQQLHQEGALLALLDKDAQGLVETKRLLNGAATVEVYETDVSQRSLVERAAEQVLKRFGHVDMLINNAGVSSSGSVEELAYETLEWTFNINLWGVIYMTKAFLPHLRQRPEANIVNLSSVYGLIGVPGQAAYCASKFAVRGFTEALRQECFGSRIAVTVVFPGGIRTNIVKNSRTDHRMDQATYLQKSQQFEAALKTSPEEAARVIIQGIKKNAPRVLIGKDARQIDFLARFMPNSYDKAIAKARQKFEKE